MLRALELRDSPRGLSAQQAFIARKLGIDSGKVRDALHVLSAMDQVKKARDRFVPRQVDTIDTGADPERAHELRVTWTSTALERLRAKKPGHYGWSLLAVSDADFVRLNNLHLQYARAMRKIIASSRAGQCVGLYCAQLLDLGR